jgi:hypothetical protein
MARVTVRADAQPAMIEMNTSNGLKPLLKILSIYPTPVKAVLLEQEGPQLDPTFGGCVGFW